MKLLILLLTLTLFTINPDPDPDPDIKESRIEIRKAEMVVISLTTIDRDDYYVLTPSRPKYLEQINFNLDGDTVTFDKIKYLYTIDDGGVTKHYYEIKNYYRSEFCTVNQLTALKKIKEESKSLNRYHRSQLSAINSSDSKSKSDSRRSENQNYRDRMRKIRDRKNKIKSDISNQNSSSHILIITGDINYNDTELDILINDVKIEWKTTPRLIFEGVNETNKKVDPNEK